MLGLYWRRGTGAAVVASFVLGVGVLVLWDLLPFSGAVHEVFPAMTLATLAYVALSAAASPVPAAERLSHRLAD